MPVSIDMMRVRFNKSIRQTRVSVAEMLLELLSMTHINGTIEGGGIRQHRAKMM
jgi:hypothetical protein